MISNKTADKIASFSKKKSTKELHSKELPNNNSNNNNEDVETTAHKKRYISPEERQQIINDLRLVPKKDGYVFRNYWWINVNVKKIDISQRKVTNYW